MKNIIFVGGLDSRDKKGFATPAPPGDLNLEQQTDLISKGYGSGANIASFRHNAATGLITQSITDNPGAVVILFSAGCSKSKAIADHLKSINQPLNLLHINEPYTCAPGGTSTANQINAAIALGVPKTNVYSGGYDCAGNNISGHTKLVGRTPGGSAAAHFNSLTPLGKLIASLKTEDPAPVATTTPAPPAQSKSVIATGPGKDFINKFNEELEKLYTEATTSLGPWKKAREEAIKITKPRIGVWPVDPAVKTIGDLFAYVFFDPDGLKFNSPPWYQIRVEGSPSGYQPDLELQKQYNDWINDMNGGMPLPTSPTGALVLDPTISGIFKSLSWPKKNGWTGNKRNSTEPIILSDSVKFIEKYTEIKKPGITNPDKYSPGQLWFDLFMQNVIGLNGENGYLKSNESRSNNRQIEEVFEKKFLNNNKKIEGDTNVYTISVSKFVKGETVPGGLSSSAYPYNRYNYADYGWAQKGLIGGSYPGFGFAKILSIEMDTVATSGGNPVRWLNQFGYGGFNIRSEKFDGLKTQYRAGVNSLESLSKDPLFNFRRTNSEDTEGDIINWTSTGTQSKETGVYWNYEVESTASSIVGNFEHILLYNAFLEAGDNYKTITLPKYPPEPVKVESPVVSTLVPTTESKLSGEFTFNVEKKNTFVVVGNQNFTLKIGDLVIEGLTTSSAIESPKTIDLGDGVILIDDGESDEIDPYVENPYQGMDEEQIISIQLSEYRNTEKKQEETKKNIENNDEKPTPLKDGTPIKDAKLSEKIVILMNTLISAGYTVNQAAGIAGNVKAESGLVQYNVENGASNIRPGGMTEKRWDSSNAKGINYNGKSNFSGIGLCQWTYGGRYQMEKFVGKYLTDKGVSVSNLKDGFFDTDPSQFSSDYNRVYGGAADVLEKHLSSVPYLFEAQCKFLVEYWLVTGKPSVAKNLKGNLSGNTSRICKNGIFINQTGGVPNTSTVAGACEIFLCDGEVPGPVGTAVNGKGKDKYIETVNERVKCSMDVLATYNSNKNKKPVA